MESYKRQKNIGISVFFTHNLIFDNVKECRERETLRSFSLVDSGEIRIFASG